MYRLCTIFGSCHRVGIHGRIELRHDFSNYKWRFQNYLQDALKEQVEETTDNIENVDTSMTTGTVTAY